MSRVGKRIINLPAGVEVLVNGTEVTVKGPKGTLSRNITSDIAVNVDNNVVTVVNNGKEKESNIFLLEAVKGGKPRMIVEPPLIVYEQQNKYTKEIYKIYGMDSEEK